MSSDEIRIKDKIKGLSSDEIRGIRYYPEHYERDMFVLFREAVAKIAWITEAVEQIADDINGMRYHGIPSYEVEEEKAAARKRNTHPVTPERHLELKAIADRITAECKAKDEIKAKAEAIAEEEEREADRKIERERDMMRFEQEGRGAVK